ncbi:helix-turn-helix transcriptional regulator [Clostridium botulinum]|uniref:helix-turn-helix domain-containing protein n=2 Tax=Clostridiaceae TaxID=31979 RepID=UPI0024AD8C47|nr:helix-turn-helix transcriptional regulator [Clostridium botulinum]MDI6921216.1 helix-turn-helix transcriptional regulator [Clostridium botulinum]WMU99495.1 helix-turn-helix transcriptional regulator [Clostridium botulinum]
MKLSEHRMTKTEFARITGTRRSATGAYSNDTFKHISKEHLDIMCRTLNCDITDIIEYIKD